MKLIFISLFFITLSVGCVRPYLGSQSSKLASPGNTLTAPANTDGCLHHQGYSSVSCVLCSLYGDALNCLTEKSSIPECVEILNVAKSQKNQVRSHFHNAVDAVDYNQINKGLQNPPGGEAVKEMAVGFKYSIDTWTEKEWGQCAEVANIKGEE